MITPEVGLGYLGSLHIGENMVRRTGDMMDILKKAGDGILLVTGNAIVNNGRLVMGAGAARAIRDMCPDAPRVFGTYIICISVFEAQYGTIIPNDVCINGTTIGLFQTKMDWRDPSTLALVEYSTQSLLDYLQKNPEVSKVDMNYPAIGLGGLRMVDVDPIISTLPDIVHVWTRR